MGLINNAINSILSAIARPLNGLVVSGKSNKVRTIQSAPRRGKIPLKIVEKAVKEVMANKATPAKFEPITGLDSDALENKEVVKQLSHLWNSSPGTYLQILGMAYVMGRDHAWHLERGNDYEN